MQRALGTEPGRTTTWLPPGASHLIDLALEEDLARGDLTTDAVIDDQLRGSGTIISREAVVVAGVNVAAEVFTRLDPQAEVAISAVDGAELPAGGEILRVHGSARGLLRAERTALNFLQRLSGIATYTQKFVAAVAGTGARIADTRKTYPGARILEKQAVRAGGGSNHRFDLGSGILIKDNHLAVAGSISEAVRRARAAAPHGLKIELEVDTLDELAQALMVGVDIVLLDNFSDEDVAKAIAKIAGSPKRPLIEVSGGITLDRVRPLAQLGVDIISVGALTHSAPAVDLSLELELAKPVDRR